MNKKEMQKEIETINTLKEAWRIFADAANYDEETLVAYYNLTKAIYGRENIKEGDVLLSRIEEMFSTLTQRQKEVLEYRFGLKGNEPISLRKTGEIYELSVERIRQIEAKALRLMRNPARTALISVLREKELDFLESKRRRKTVTRNEDLLINDVGFSVRTFNCLARARIKTLGDLSKYTYEKLIRIRNLGRRSMDEVIEKLQEYGITLRNE